MVTTRPSINTIPSGTAAYGSEALLETAFEKRTTTKVAWPRRTVRGSSWRSSACATSSDGTFSSAEPRTLFEGRYFEADPGGPNYDVARDDQRFLMVLSGDTDGPDRLNVVQGWKAELLKRLRGNQ